MSETPTVSIERKVETMSCNKGKCQCRDRNSRDTIALEKFKATRQKLHSSENALAAECLQDRVGWIYLYGKEGSEYFGYIEITGRGYEVPLDKDIAVYDQLFRAEEVLYGWFKREGYFKYESL